MGGGAWASAQGVTEAETVTLEIAVEADLDEIVDLERASFSDPWSRASFEAVLGEPTALVVVARNASARLAGYVVAWFVADEGEIANLAVREPGRRRGIGSMLLSGALAEGYRRGARNMYLEVRESNEAARQLYASRGFEEIGRRRGYYKRPVEDAIVLRLELK